jgi:hypothetical protein
MRVGPTLGRAREERWIERSSSNRQVRSCVDAIVGSASGLPDACDRGPNLNAGADVQPSSFLRKGEI